MKEINIQIQKEIDTCGQSCLIMIAEYYEKKIVNYKIFSKKLIGISRGVSLLDLKKAAELIGFNTITANISFERLKENTLLPCIALWFNKHYIIIEKISKNKVFIVDPIIGRKIYKQQEFLFGWQNKNSNLGTVLIFEI